MEIPFQYLQEQYNCSCGQTHSVPIEQVVVKETMLDDVLGFLSGKGVKRVLVVADTITYRVCGQDVYDAISGSEFKFDSHQYVFPQAHDLLPDDEAIEAVRKQIRTCGTELAVAVGSGVINDIVRFATFQELSPYIVVATAPSMDGFASTVAALQFKGVKTTLPAHAPLAIFANPNVLAGAPWELIQSGFGDLIGKIISLLDWKLSNALYEEYLCKESYQVVWEPLRYCFEHAEQIRERDPEAIRNLFIGLINSGISMAMMGNSRPASGSEHHCSHYWDFLAFINQRPHASHGIQVGYAAHWMMDVYLKIQQLQVVREPLPIILDDAWVASVRERYGDGANAIIYEQQNKKQWLEQRNKQAAIGSKDIKQILAHLEPELSSFEFVRKSLETIGIPHVIGYLDVSKQMLEQTYLHAYELRARYTVLDFLQGQGLLEQTAKEIVDKC
jgi:glycerol-1-phosphate dehydrogenase [NAD(P)+]